MNTYGQQQQQVSNSLALAWHSQSLAKRPSNTFDNNYL
jgi:hypothetical protein